MPIKSCKSSSCVSSLFVFVNAHHQTEEANYVPQTSRKNQPTDQTLIKRQILTLVKQKQILVLNSSFKSRDGLDEINNNVREHWLNPLRRPLTPNSPLDLSIGFRYRFSSTALCLHVMATSLVTFFFFPFEKERIDFLKFSRHWQFYLIAV